MLETVCADKAVLICDGEEAGAVDYSISVRRDAASRRSSASGYLLARGETLAACGACQTAAIDSGHFGRLLIRLNRIEGARVDFDVMEPSLALRFDPPLAPDLTSPEEPEVLPSFRALDADW